MVPAWQLEAEVLAGGGHQACGTKHALLSQGVLPRPPPLLALRDGAAQTVRDAKSGWVQTAQMRVFVGREDLCCGLAALQVHPGPLSKAKCGSNVASKLLYPFAEHACQALFSARGAGRTCHTAELAPRCRSSVRHERSLPPARTRRLRSVWAACPHRGRGRRTGGTCRT